MAIDQREALIAAVRAQVEKEKRLRLLSLRAKKHLPVPRRKSSNLRLLLPNS